jgi:hypothetical protein
VSSLSPEQQAFAKAVRALQVESSLFGVAILQIKPQLEAVLNLPKQSLTKEIVLTQQLLDLFVQYQLPTDLVSYQEANSVRVEADFTPVADQLAQVKSHVNTMTQMIQTAKNDVLKEAEHLAKVRNAERLAKVREAEEEEERRRNSYRLESLECMQNVSESLNRMEPQMELQSASFTRGSKGVGIQNELYSSKSGLGTRLLGIFSSTNSASLSSSPKESTNSASSSSSSARATAIAFSAPAARMPTAKPTPRSIPVIVAAPTTVVAVVQEGKEQTNDGDDGEDDVSVVRGTTERDANVAAQTSQSTAIEWTRYPIELDKVCEAAGLEGAALRPTTLEVGKTWERSQYANLLAKRVTTKMQKAEQATAKHAAFDLIDALSRSGALSFDDAELHIVLSVTHNFDLSLIDTVVQQNINPITHLERSMDLLAETLTKGNTR